MIKSLEELNLIYKTDKGIAHKYLPFYENVFSVKRFDSLKILEIGVLFGASLKLWNDYFTNSTIFGIDDFSHKTGQDFYSFKPLIKEEVLQEFSVFERVKIVELDSQDYEKVHKTFENVKFDIIIDDGNHSINFQIKTFENFHTLLSENGLYICEDVQSQENADKLKLLFSKHRGNRNNGIIDFNTEFRFDDRIVYSI